MFNDGEKQLKKGDSWEHIRARLVENLYIQFKGSVHCNEDFQFCNTKNLNKDLVDQFREEAFKR